jgi:hypothetical protein
MQEKNAATASMYGHILIFSIDIRRPGYYHPCETEEESQVKPQGGYFVHR